MTAVALLVLHTGKLNGSEHQLVTAIALLVLHTGKLNGSEHQLVTAIALLVLHTDKLGKCAPVEDCYSSLCFA